MRKQLLPACVVGAVLTLGVWGLAQRPSVGVEDDTPWVIRIPEVSGAAALPGDRLLLVADDPDTDDLAGAVFEVEHAAKCLATGDVRIPSQDCSPLLMQSKLGDLEDVAWDGEQKHAYLVTSHSLSRKGNGSMGSPERYRIALLDFASDGKVTKPPLVSVRLLDALSPELRHASERTPAQCGLNIEGAAWTEDRHLLLGLRSPTVTHRGKRMNKLQEDAVVLDIENPDLLFADKGELRITETVLNLEGRGIRAMCYDPGEKGIWIVAGLSPDPNYDVEDTWQLWFWGNGRKTLQRKDVAQLRGSFEGARKRCPEAVCRIGPDLLLVYDCGDEKPPGSPYAFCPVPKP